MSSITLRNSLVLGAILFQSGLGFVSAQAGEKADEHPCAAEIKKICADKKPGDSLKECVQKNHDKFSDACKAKMKEHMDKIREAIKACESDSKKLCGDVKPGKGAIRDCLIAHKADVKNEECKALLDKAPKAHE